MKTSELVQSTMTPEVSQTYHAVRRVAIQPPRDPNEFVERLFQALRHHPEQIRELAGRWHRRVTKMRREEKPMADPIFGKIPEPIGVTYSVTSGEFEGDDELRGSRLTLPATLAVASKLFAAHQERRVEEGLPRLEAQFGTLDDAAYSQEDEGLGTGWRWYCDENAIVGEGDDSRLGVLVYVYRDDPAESVA